MLDTWILIRSRAEQQSLPNDDPDYSQLVASSSMDTSCNFRFKSKDHNTLLFPWIDFLFILKHDP